VLDALRPGDELKLVLAGREDYEWARQLLQATRDKLPPEVPVHFSPVFGVLRPDDLAAWILADRLPVRLNLQIHKWIWDPKARGV
jgi:7-carboxy-7-deazaguanine synthase